MKRACRTARPLAIAVLALAAGRSWACAPFDATSEDTTTTSTGAPEASTPPEPGPSDAGTPPECGAIASPVSGDTFRARRAPSSCAPWFTLSRDTAEHVQFGDSGASAMFSVVWEPDRIVVAARVDDPTPNEGNDLDLPHPNDCIHVYVDGDGEVGGKYDANTRMLVVDHRGLFFLYNSSTGAKTKDPAGASARVLKRAEGFDVEMAIQPSLVGQQEFTSGQKLGFDLATTDGRGETTNYRQFLVWKMSEGPCTDCMCSEKDTPNCNSRRFGKLELMP